MKPFYVFKPWALILLLTAVLDLPFPHALQAEKADAPRLKVSGYGLLGGRELQKYLRMFSAETNRTKPFDANFIEDGGLLLLSRVQADGYLKPVIFLEAETLTGEIISRSWTNVVLDPLPRPLSAKKVHFSIQKGIRYFYQDLHFTGLSLVPEKKARSFFYPSGMLLPLKVSRFYTKEKFERSMGNLEENLRRMGYEQARVILESQEINRSSGAVSSVVKVIEGPLVTVRSARVETQFSGSSPPQTSLSTNIIGLPFSKYWLQDFIYQLKLPNYHQGFPDVRVQTEIVRREGTNPVHLDLQALVIPGPKVKVAEVDFSGHKKSKTGFLASKVPLKSGDLLDRTRADQGRFRLARLGAFRSVEMDYEVLSPELWKVRYHLKEDKRLEINLLAGFGSYELLRGGVELQRNNLWGRGHQDRLRLIQSMKSSSVDYLYTMPEFFGREADVFLNSSWLEREEVSFTRQEFGGGAGVKKEFKKIQSDVILRYLFEVIDTLNADPLVGPRGADVGAAILEVRHDRQDNPLYPRKGYKLIQRIEAASDYLGGDVNYQKLEFSGSVHHPLWEGQWMHYGFSHGIINSPGSSRLQLPFGKRFFPGGDTTIRGFRQGEAASRNSSGKLIGAETYLGGNVEFEQSLTEKFSMVTFLDAMGVGDELGDYPFAEYLVSVGAGIRLRTVLGPVRLEYGYNLRRRDHDPHGAIHLSVGFPF